MVIYTAEKKDSFNLELVPSSFLILGLTPSKMIVNDLSN